MSWNSVLNVLSFTGVKDVTVWQDILFGVLLIPPAIEGLRRFLDWLGSKRPLHLLLKGYLSGGTRILIFPSQLSVLDDSGQLDSNPQYVIKYPNPTPTNRSALSLAPRQNIDPVWAEGDGECLADVYNVLGKAGKVGNIKVAGLISDWDKWSNPIFAIGFNPKTISLERKCTPVYYEATANAGLKIRNHDLELDSIIPNDAAVVQKTFIKDTNIPVFILAGLGTMGTSAAGYFLRENCEDIGKLYGDKPFCFLLYVNINEGRGSVTARGVYPRPSIVGIALHPLTYFKFRRRSTFSR